MRPGLFLQIALLEARTRMSYRVDFWLNAVVSFAVELGIAYFLWDAMFRESRAAAIAGYDLEQMILYYVAVILVGRLVRGPELLGGVSTDIYEGGLNRYLVLPTRYFGFKYAQSLGSLLPAFVQFLLLGTAFVLTAGSAAETVRPVTVAMALPSILVANLLYFTLSFSVQAVAFWADNVWSLAVAQRLTASVLGGALVPLAVFPPAARTILVAMPFRFLYDQPVGVLSGRIGVAEWASGLALGLAWTIGLGAVARLVWSRGQLQYSGIGI